MPVLASILLIATLPHGGARPEKAPETKKDVKTFTNSKADLSGDQAEQHIDAFPSTIRPTGN